MRIADLSDLVNEDLEKPVHSSVLQLEQYEVYLDINNMWWESMNTDKINVKICIG